MKELYTKTLLYSYPCLSNRIKSVEEKSIRIGFNSYYLKTMVTIERMIDLYEEKRLYIKLERIISLIKSRLPPEDINLLEYKYFRNDSSEPVTDFDYTSRRYFRKQNKLLKHLSWCFDLCGLTDEFFEKECLRFDFIRAMLLVTEDHEKKHCNKYRRKDE